MKRSDGILAAGLALVSLAAGWCWRLACVVPANWDDLAAALRVRPAQHLTGSLATVAMTACGGEVGVLSWAGGLVTALSVVGVYCLARQVPAYLMLRRPQGARRRDVVLQTAAAFATLGFALAEPVWRAGQCLDQTAVVLGLAVFSGVLFLSFLARQSAGKAFALALLTGVLCAESVCGLVLAVVYGTVLLVEYRIAQASGLTAAFLADIPIVRRFRWSLTAVFLLGLVSAYGADVWNYAASGALAGEEEPVLAVMKASLLELCRTPAEAGGAVPLLLWAGFQVVPFAVTVICYPRAADEEFVLSYGTGIVLAACGLVAAVQFGCVSGLWFWSYAPGLSGTLQTLGLVLNALTLTLAASVVGVEAVCRDFRRLFGRAAADAAVTLRVQEGQQRQARRAVTFVAVLLLALVLGPRSALRTAVGMSEVVAQGVAAMVAECDGARFLFSDGKLDAALDVAAARQGLPLRCVSLLGSARRQDVLLRTRGLADDSEDLRTFTQDAGMGLRLWLRDKPARRSACACQLGFDLWKRAGLALPPMGGFVARPDGWSEPAVRARGLAAARELADRILGLVAAGVRSAYAEPSLRQAFEAVQWRLARMCFYRSEVAEQQGNAELALAEQAASKRLLDTLPSYQRMLAEALRRSEQIQQAPTSREGLMQALLTADFTRAKVFADIVLQSDPNEAHANFALAMYCVKRRQFALAEAHLKRCLIQKPNDAAIYNNLAMVQAELGHYADALDSVDRAAAILPDAAEIAATRKFIKERQAKAAK